MKRRAIAMDIALIALAFLVVGGCLLLAGRAVYKGVKEAPYILAQIQEPDPYLRLRTPDRVRSLKELKPGVVCGAPFEGGVIAYLPIQEREDGLFYALDELLPLRRIGRGVYTTPNGEARLTYDDAAEAFRVVEMGAERQETYKCLLKGEDEY